jgi:hypothetical protein
VFKLSFFFLRLADANFVNSYVPPIAAGVLLAVFHRACRENNIPKTAIVEPLLVKTPHGPTFFLARAFWTADMNNPAPPVIIVPVIAAPMASCG